MKEDQNIWTTNRELSWLKFNERVLEEANCDQTPLYERLKFLSIFTSNLDEFYMVRVGSLYDLSLVEADAIDNKSGMTPSQQLDAIFHESIRLYQKKDETYHRITVALRNHNICQIKYKDLTDSQKKHVDKYFKASILPLLSPQIIDNSHPFPHLINKLNYIAVSLENHNQSKENRKITLGIIPVPNALGRFVFLPECETHFMLMEDLILEFADEIFKMYSILEKTIICVTRNADIDTDEGLVDVDVDFRQHMKKILKKRARLAPVRLEIQNKISKQLNNYLCGKLNIKSEQVFVSNSPLNMSFVYALEDRIPPTFKAYLSNEPFAPQDSPSISLNRSIIRQISKQDLLLSYPFESMQPFLKLIKEASADHSVLSIKITLYRIARESKLAEYLINAAENGKEVTVLMELRARFDEQNNIEWAQRLEEAGCNVIYGFDGYKVHSKICLITRRDHGKISYITQIGTGNYNEKTSKLYTDLSLITANPAICKDAVEFFNNMGLGNLEGKYEHLWIAPVGLKPGVMQAIDEEIAKAKAGNPARIIMKMNSLTDRDVIDKLAEASQAGVEIKLIIRGICCLIPGIQGLTDHISVISIVGRFLEHSRIYCFGYDAQMKLYISSADMMTRNTERRVEIACPIYDKKIKERIFSMLEIMLRDNTKARQLNCDNHYTFVTNDLPKICSQEYFMKQAIQNASHPRSFQEERTGLLSSLRQKFHRKS